MANSGQIPDGSNDTSVLLEREKLLRKLALLEKHTAYSPPLVREIDNLMPSVLACGNEGSIKLVLRFGRLLERATNVRAHRDFLRGAQKAFDDPAVNLALAVTSLRCGDKTEAKQLVVQLPEALPPELCIRAARISRSIADLPRALSFLERAALAEPEHYGELLTSLHASGRTARAITLVQQRIKALEKAESLDSLWTHEVKAFATILPALRTEIAPVKMLLRFSKLLRRSSGIQEQRTFLAAIRQSRSDLDLELVYATALVDCGNDAEAESVLAALGSLAELSGEMCGKIARLYRRLQNPPEACSFFVRAAEGSPLHLADLIQSLVWDGENTDALDRARVAIASENPGPTLLFACYVAFVAAGVPDDETARLREIVLSAARQEGAEPYWAARLYRFERKYDQAVAVLTAALIANPSDQQLVRERLSVMLISGEWGKYRSDLQEAKAAISATGELGEKLRSVERFLRDFGTDEDLAELRIPDAIFRKVVASSAPQPPSGSAHSLLMIGASLAPGGAERIFAMLARQLASSGKLDEVKVRFADLDSRRRRDFYLPTLETSPVQVSLLERRCRPESPVDFLPPEHAKTTQAVLAAVRQERPDVLYAALEPLTVFGALAGLIGGVPRIIMHSHNMPPTELNPHADFPDRLKQCYRYLLSLPNVLLLTCAEAAARSYREWLGVDSDNILHVHNGLDFSALKPADEAIRQAIRTELGIGRDHFVVGTAFSFRDEKQPLLWLDAAAAIHARHPNTSFVMYGDGRLWEQAKTYAQAKGISAALRFPGLVTDLYRRLPALDLFMLSSRSEALPNVLIEAQAVGVPVISLPVGGAPETFQDNKTGLLARGLSYEDLAAAALRAIADERWREGARRHAPEFVRAKFGLEKMANRVLDVLRGVRQ